MGLLRWVNLSLKAGETSKLTGKLCSDVMGVRGIQPPPEGSAVGFEQLRRSGSMLSIFICPCNGGGDEAARGRCSLRLSWITQRPCEEPRWETETSSLPDGNKVHRHHSWASRAEWVIKPLAVCWVFTVQPHHSGKPSKAKQELLLETLVLTLHQRYINIARNFESKSVSGNIDVDLKPEHRSGNLINNLQR